MKLLYLVLNHAAEEWNGRRASGSRPRHSSPSHSAKGSSVSDETGLTHKMSDLPGAARHLPGKGCRSRYEGSGGLSRPATGVNDIPAITQSWRRNWEHVVPFFAFPESLRRVIYTTNQIEALNSKLRRAVRTRGHFPSDDAAMKLPYLVLNHAAEEWKRTPREWSRPRPNSPSSSAKGLSASDQTGLTPPYAVVGDILLAYKAYDSDAIRAKAKQRKAWANIPPKANRNGTFSFSAWLYRQRNLVERFFNSIKHLRGIAPGTTRTPANYLAAVKFVAPRIWCQA